MHYTRDPKSAQLIGLTAGQFCAALESVPAGMLMVDAGGRITFANSTTERLFGYEHGELIGRAVECLVPRRVRDKHPDYRLSFSSELRGRAMGAGRDLYGVRKDGSEVPVEIGLTPVITPEGHYVLSSIVDITERKRSEEQFRAALEAAPTGMLMVDSTGNIALLNAQIEKLFGYTRAELMGRKIETLVPERFRGHHHGYFTGYLTNPETRPMGHGRELYGVRKDGTEMPVEIGLNPLTTSGGKFVLASIVDISERKHTVQRLTERTAELAGTVREREVLLQEIHHRVKNNLQIITSLINMQMRTLNSSPSRQVLNECKTRVEAIALIHEKLYQSRDFSNVPFAQYARGLVSTIFQASYVSFARVRAEFSIDEIALPVAQAIPCGLILNELVTNAVKHAFPEERSGSILISLHETSPTSLRFEVIDDGVGTHDIDRMQQGDSIGLHLVQSLTSQLEGQLAIKPGLDARGLRVTIDFPLSSDSRVP